MNASGDTGISVSDAGPLNAGAPRRAYWPWLTTALIFLAFFLGVHDLHASQHWYQREVSALADEAASGRAARQAGFLVLGTIGVIYLVRRGAISMRPRPLLLFPLLMLVLWVLVSAAWSADAALTLKRQVVLVCMLLAAAGLIKHFTLAQLAEMALVQSLIVVVLGVVVEFVLRPTLSVSDDEYRFAGTLYPNNMAINASLLLLTSLFVAHHRADRRFLLISVVAVVTLLMTRSRTALLSACIGSVVFALLAYARRYRIVLIFAILLTLGLALAAVATGFFSDLAHAVLMNRGHSDPATLTGRTMIWQFAYDRVRDDWGRMFTGFGYGGFWTPEMSLALSERAQFALSEAHNAYLDILLQLGLPGLGLYLWCLLGTLWVWMSAGTRSASSETALAAGLICFALSHQLAESAMSTPTFPTLVLWCIIGWAAFHREADHARRRTFWMQPVLSG